MIFDYARKQKYIEENPIREIHPFSIPETTTRRVITDSDLKKILQALPKHWIDVFKFLLYTGLRNSELTNLTWDNFSRTKKGRKYIHSINIL